MWQTIAIIVTGIMTASYIGWKIYKFLCHKPKTKTSCYGCKGCELKKNNRSLFSKRD